MSIDYSGVYLVDVGIAYFKSWLKAQNGGTITTITGNDVRTFANQIRGHYINNPDDWKTLQKELLFIITRNPIRYKSAENLFKIKNRDLIIDLSEEYAKLLDGNASEESNGTKCSLCGQHEGAYPLDRTFMPYYVSGTNWNAKFFHKKEFLGCTRCTFFLTVMPFGLFKTVMDENNKTTGYAAFHTDDEEIYESIIDIVYTENNNLIKFKNENDLYKVVYKALSEYSQNNQSNRYRTSVDIYIFNNDNRDVGNDLKIIRLPDRNIGFILEVARDIKFKKDISKINTLEYGYFPAYRIFLSDINFLLGKKTLKTFGVWLFKNFSLDFIKLYFKEVLGMPENIIDYGFKLAERLTEFYKKSNANFRKIKYLENADSRHEFAREIVDIYRRTVTEGWKLTKNHGPGEVEKILAELKKPFDSAKEFFDVIMNESYDWRMLKLIVIARIYELLTNEKFVSNIDDLDGEIDNDLEYESADDSVF
ncbi:MULTISPECIES: hypothetical protein [Thermoanaerobacterium]|uniref:Uncharacterized protein n=2 Tax=Thermoanaerobacterium TaxID=28895 RepID=W9EEJ7_9THEO|nr:MULTISPECIES: hypothetical protein [Thermoanaerobacterium]AFK85612.1 hypothetical protein Tsac_0586 [Thermoanaerobacterium saccharolyticum JW/SL-YS485]ETO39671.1 hypothetical protein V518_0102 [Thermoanaerobacterium aotearoense SCUT27]